MLGFWIKTLWQEKQGSQWSIENFRGNSIFYLQNMREIIFNAKKKNILVGMVDLPALYEKRKPNEKMKKLYQFINTSIEHMDYRLKAGLKTFIN